MYLAVDPGAKRAGEYYPQIAYGTAFGTHQLEEQRQTRARAMTRATTAEAAVVAEAAAGRHTTPTWVRRHVCRRAPSLVME